MYRFFSIALLAIGVAGCAATLARTPVPEQLVDRAKVARMPEIRFWGDQLPADFDDIVAVKIAQARASRPQMFAKGTQSSLNYLALSGGGSDGAYGAGVLSGWTQSGDRPEFEVVTGVSTGALTAPFAFLGSTYDKTLKDIYTTHSTDELLTSQALAGLLGGAALTDNSGLKMQLTKYITPQVLNQIAQQHRRGRRLLVATTNLDAQRPVIWDMGAIASSGAPHALQLFRNVMLASAAIPGVFPPVIINVDVDGKKFEELHVDGGTVGQVFFLPSGAFGRKSVQRQIRRARSRLYVILNGKFAPEFASVQPTTLSIASRSMATLLKAQGNGDVFRLYSNAITNHLDFNLAAIPPSFSAKTSEPFDPVYMKALFEQGFSDAASGYSWMKAPPGKL